MARRRRPEQASAQPDDEPPEWFWNGCDLRQWLRAHDGQLEGFHAAKVAWLQRRQEWVQERGLVVSGMPGLTHEEYKRIRREEPHRILRWPASRQG